MADTQLSIFNRLGNLKEKEFVITAEQMVMDDDLVWKYTFFIDTLREMLRLGIIKHFEIYDRPQDLCRVVKVIKN